MSNLKLKKKSNSLVGKAYQTIEKQMDKGSLDLPDNYSAKNALQSAALVLQETRDRKGRPALEVATDISIVNSLLQMVQAGLNPGKDQVNFIVYGKRLVAQPSYFGNMALAKRIGATHVVAQAVYEDDDFEYHQNQAGLTIIDKHKQTLQTKDGDIIGAYASIYFDDRPPLIEIMTIKQIKRAWEQGNYKEGSNKTPHSQFSEEMAKKTVINRACKSFIKSSDDSSLAMQDIVSGSRPEAEIEEEQEEKMATGETIDVTPEEPTDEPEEEPTEDTEEEEGPEEGQETFGFDGDIKPPWE